MERNSEQMVRHLKERYWYDREAGLVRNRKNHVVKGYERRGYLRKDIYIDGKQHFVSLAYIVWAVTHDSMPVGQIDHINGNPKDNRVENLREVTPSENDMNRVWAWKPNAKTGLPGVSKSGNRLVIKVQGKQYIFRNKYEAFHTLTMLGRMWNEE